MSCPVGASCPFDRVITHSVQTAPTVKLRLKAYLNLLLPPFAPLDCLSYITWAQSWRQMGVLHFLDPWAIRPFRVSEDASWQLRSVLPPVGSLPYAGPNVYVIIRVLRLRFVAAFKLSPQSLLDLEGALGVGDSVFLFLQFGVVVGKLVEQNGDGHAVEDDAKRDAAECHTAAKIGDRDDIAIAHSRDAHL